MGLSKALQQFYQDAKAKDRFWVEQTKLDFSLALEHQRRIAGMTYAAIAEKIGTSAAYITKVFRGDANLTIESMVKLARATGGRVNIQIIDTAIDHQRWARKFAQTKQKPEAANQAYTRTGTVLLFAEYAKDKMAA